MITEEKRIVLVSFSELPTLQKYMYLTFSELRQRGVEVWTVGSKHLTCCFELCDRNILVETPHSPKPSLSSVMDAMREARELARRIDEFSPDVVHFVNKHTWNFFLIRVLRREMPKVKIVHTFHDPVGHSGDTVQKGVILYHKVIQKMLDGVVVHSDIACHQATEQLVVPCSLYQVPLGVCPWHEWNHSVNSKRALIFGRINAYKGVILYPDILRSLAKVAPGIEVVIAGKASDDVDRVLLDEIAAQPNAKLVNRFIDESELDGFFDDCGVVLMPYTSITQSGVVLDAYSHSRSVVAFSIEGIAQYVPNAEELIEPFNCDAYAAKIVEILSDVHALNARNRDAWEFGRNNFSPEAMAEGLLDVYRGVSGKVTA